MLEACVRLVSAGVRRIPINRKIKGLFIRSSMLLRKRRFAFDFYCAPSGVRWTAQGFPDLMTRHMLFEGMYQEDVLLALRHLIAPGDVVFDIGGHHGLMAVVGAKAAGPGGKVVTFEPNPGARAHLERHLALNGVDNVAVEPVALSDRRGKTRFYVQNGDTTWNSTLIGGFARRMASTSVLTASTLSLDDYVAESGLAPDVIKLDAEGAEFVILNGARKTIEKHRPVLIAEFNPEAAEAAGTTIGDYARYFRDRLYDLRVLRRNLRGYFDFARSEPFDAGRHLAGGDLANVICIPAERRARPRRPFGAFHQPVACDG